MTTTPPPAPAPGTTGVATPVVPRTLTRGLGTAVLTVNAVAMLFAAAVLAVIGRAEYWPAFAAAAVTGAIGAIASVLILSQAAGRTVEWLVTYVMATSAVRLFTSLIGLLVAVNGFKTQPGVTGLLICCFFVLTLLVESARLHTAVRDPVGETHV